MSRNAACARVVIGAPGLSAAQALQPGVSLPLLHRSVLDSKESNLKAALQELESERGKERALQSRLEEELLQHLQREGQSSKTLEVPGRGAGGGRRGWQVGLAGGSAAPHRAQLPVSLWSRAWWQGVTAVKQACVCGTAASSW